MALKLRYVKDRSNSEFTRLLKQCEKEKNKMDCMMDILYAVTEIQDRINLTIREDLDDSDDPRWVPIHIIDNANAIILGIARNGARPKLVLREGYVDSKVSNLIDNWEFVKRKYGRLD